MEWNGDHIRENQIDKVFDKAEADMKVKTEANVYEPFEEVVQLVGVKQLEDVSTIVEDEINVDVIRKF